MFEEEYFIHSDVFSTTNDGNFHKNSFQFFIVLNENNEEIKIDNDGDLDLYRPERIDLTLGIYLKFKTELGSGLFE
jgi:hypothetical protein